jgi:hypothetical protein
VTYPKNFDLETDPRLLILILAVIGFVALLVVAKRCHEQDQCEHKRCPPGAHAEYFIDATQGGHCVCEQQL